MYVSIVLKMDNFHEFQEFLNQKVLGFLFHTLEAMGNKTYEQHGFSFYMYMCVDVVGNFAMDLVIMMFHNKCTYLQIVQFFISVHSIHRCIFNP